MNKCYSCHHDCSSIESATPEEFKDALQVFTDSVYDGMVVSCTICGCDVMYTRNEDDTRWIEVEL